MLDNKKEAKETPIKAFRLPYNEIKRAKPLAEELYDIGEVRFELDPDVFINNWETIVRCNNGIFIGLFNEESNMVGALGGIQTVILRNNEKIAIEQFWHIHPEYREKNCSLMFTLFEEWAEEMGAKYIQVSCALDKNLTPERAENIYKEKGYQPAEKHFMKEIN